MKRKLTKTIIKKAKLESGESSKKFTDGGGLFLLINKSGKYWRYNFRIKVNNKVKNKTFSIGVYSEEGIDLEKARELHLDAHNK